MELQKLIEELTDSKSDYLDDVKCHELKVLCRMSNENISRAFYLVWAELERGNSHVRLLSVQIIDILFCRSAVFRDLLLPLIQEFAKFSLGIDPMYPLPSPKTDALKLKQKTIYIIKKWYDKYGSFYKSLKLAYNFLKDCKGIAFDDVIFSNQREELSDKQKEEFEKTVKLNVAAEQLNVLKNDMMACISELQGCLDLLIPRPSEFNIFSSVGNYTEARKVDCIYNDRNDDDDDSYEVVSGDENEDCGSFHLRLHGIKTQRMHLVLDFNENNVISVKKNEDNADILLTMKEKMILLSETYMPSLNEILDFFMRYNSTSEDCDNANILKTNAENVLKKAKKIDMQESDESDYDDFIEVSPLGDEIISDTSNNTLGELPYCSSNSGLNSSATEDRVTSKKRKTIHQKDSRNKRILKNIVKSLRTKR